MSVPERQLKGLPAPVGTSHVWRIEPGSLHATCGSSPACKVVAGGFTSIVDLTLGQDGSVYVIEIDEASCAAVKFRVGALGGTVNRCNSSTWSRAEIATGLPVPIAATVGRDGTVFVVIQALEPGAAQVIALP